MPHVNTTRFCRRAKAQVTIVEGVCQHPCLEDDCMYAPLADQSRGSELLLKLVCPVSPDHGSTAWEAKRCEQGEGCLAICPFRTEVTT
jgi:hypothetical protein